MHKKILYIMHVDWNWIKQRPHFLAEKLDLATDILVLYPFALTRTNLVPNKKTVKTLPFFQLPFRRYKLFDMLNTLLQKIFFFITINYFNPDIIWICHPSIYNYLPKEFYKNTTIVYDCMDDALAFSDAIRNRKINAHMEKCLLNRADIVFASSKNLAQKIITRGCVPSKVTVVRNAFNGDIVKVNNKNRAENRIFKICYIGTISDWIDFDSLLFCLDLLTNIEFHFIGPVSASIPNNDRLIFYGPTKHSNLVNLMLNYDCMIMPFKVNDLIVSVDPVKLYEYINYNKNIISIYYNELDRFDSFVYFYRDKFELKQVIKQLIQNNTIKYSNIERLRFLHDNTWDIRNSLIIDKLNSI